MHGGMWMVCDIADVWMCFEVVLCWIGECGGCVYAFCGLAVGITPCSVGRACFSWHASEGIVTS